MDDEGEHEAEEWEDLRPEYETWQDLVDSGVDILDISVEFDDEGLGFIHFETEDDWYDFAVDSLDDWDAIFNTLEDEGHDLSEIEEWYH